MTTDEKILETMLERVTNPKNPEPDNKAMQMFLLLVKNDSGLVKTAHDLIIKKMHSLNPIEANRAIGLLEECMSQAGPQFQERTAKFKFLNEFTRIIDDPECPVATKRRILECLLMWTVKHSDLTKIHSVYSYLKGKVDTIEHELMTTTHVSSANNSTITPMEGQQRSSILGKDDTLLAKLLKAGGVENREKANTLIKLNYNHAIRTELTTEIKNTMDLLSEMLGTYSTETPDADSRESIKELYIKCKRYNEKMEKLLEIFVDSEPELSDHILKTKDLIVLTLKRYKELFGKDVCPKTAEETNINPTATTTPLISSANTDDLLSELLGDVVNLGGTTNTNCETNDTLKPSTTLDAIFDSNETTTKQINYPADLLGNLDLLEPISVFEIETAAASAKDAGSETTNDDEDTTKPQGFKELREIDKISEEIFKKILPTELRQTTFKKEPEKITLNDLAKEKIQSTLKTNNNNTDNDHKSNVDCKTIIEKDDILKVELDNVYTPPPSECDQEIVTTLKVKQNENHDKKYLQKNNEKETCEKLAEQSCKTLPLKPLAEITIDLDEVTPLEEGNRILFDDDIQVAMNFTANRPIANVSVIVMTVSNKSRLRVNECQFEASVSKPCKVRLLPPTDTTMGPFKLFRPPLPINQIILLFNPTQKSVDLKYLVSYTLGEDRDPIKELIVAKDIPYV